MRRAGASGLVLPPISLGLWQNFGDTGPFRTQRELILTAYDLGVWHFDTANRYGPPHGWAEEILGTVLRTDLRSHRNDIVVATKAGNPIGSGPYGRGGSRKHLLEALDDSLRRLRLDHVDVFYSHSPDPDTPLHETVSALASAVRGGKALYVGISNYSADRTREAADLLRAEGVPLVVHQHKYSLLHRDVPRDPALGFVAYSPLAQGLLTDRYADGTVPAGARAAWSTFLSADFLTDDYLKLVGGLREIAVHRGQTIAQLALQWVLHDPAVTTAIIGASGVDQLRANLAALDGPPLAPEELAAIGQVVANHPRR